MIFVKRLKKRLVPLVSGHVTSSYIMETYSAIHTDVINYLHGFCIETPAEHRVGDIL